jgi:hypothetical protein
MPVLLSFPLYLLLPATSCFHGAIPEDPAGTANHADETAAHHFATFLRVAPPLVFGLTAGRV